MVVVVMAVMVAVMVIIMLMVVVMVMVVVGCWRRIIDGGRRIIDGGRRSVDDGGRRGVDDGRRSVVMMVIVRVHSMADGMLLGQSLRGKKRLFHFAYSNAVKNAVIVVMIVMMVVVVRHLLLYARTVQIDVSGNFQIIYTHHIP